MLYYIGTIFAYLTCFFKWKKNAKQVKTSNNIVKKTMKDTYTFNRSSLLRAEKPVPKYGDVKKLKNIPIELEDLEEEESSTMLINKAEKRNKESRKKLLDKLEINCINKS